MKTLKLQSGMVYGPVGSRRIGLSLGVNLSPTTQKLCTFNCVYCHYGWTKILTADPRDFLRELPDVNGLAKELDEYAVDHFLLDHITFSGNGEATLHPDFSRAVEIIADFRNHRAPQARTAILSNSSMVSKPEVRAALLKLDRRIMKLDAGDEETFRKVNRAPSDVRFGDIVSGLKVLGDFETQTIFIDGSASNSGESAVKSWLDVMLELKPRGVQIYTLDRPPADNRLVAVGRERMRDIFYQAKKAGLPVTLH